VFCKFGFKTYLMVVIYLMFFSRVPELDRCQIYNASLVDPQLKKTYRNIPKLPRYLIYGIVYIFLIFFLGWQTMRQLGDPVVMMVVFNFQRSSVPINPQMWSESYFLLDLMISINIWHAVT
jgi:hypothetical protein